MKAIILAGGGGTRLFPLSRSSYPKQFLQLHGGKSLLAQTVERMLTVVEAKDLVVVTNQDYIHHVKAELQTCGGQAAHVLLEPVGRNTAPAIMLAIQYCQEILKAEPDEILFVSPSDHVIHPLEAFKKGVKAASALAREGKIVTFGIRPDKPETGYGYIEVGEKLIEGFRVKSFKEKPDYETAKKYLAEGTYYWNSGMFIFAVDVMEQEINKFEPAIMELARKGMNALEENFAAMPNISLDCAVAERSNEVAVIEFPAYWNDIGSWDALYDVMEKDVDGNAVEGDCLLLGCSNNLIMGRSRLIAGIALEDLLVVETDDVIVVAKKGESQQVKEVVANLKIRGRKEADVHTTQYRPWGSHSLLGSGPGYQMRKVIISPGQRLQTQMHYHRSEHWIITRGTAKVILGEEKMVVHENESVFVPKCKPHQLENPGKIPLEIIEVQSGEYLEDDDIVWIKE